jgi:hypothetical protein
MSGRFVHGKDLEREKTTLGSGEVAFEEPWSSLR